MDAERDSVTLKNKLAGTTRDGMRRRPVWPWLASALGKNNLEVRPPRKYTGSFPSPTISCLLSILVWSKEQEQSCRVSLFSIADLLFPLVHRLASRLMVFQASRAVAGNAWLYHCSLGRSIRVVLILKGQ